MLNASSWHGWKVWLYYLLVSVSGLEWFRSTFPCRRYANTLDTDSVPIEHPFARYVPKDTCLHDEVDLRFRCTRITWRKQLDDEEEKQSNIKIGSGRSNRPLYPNEKAFVFLSQGIAAPGSQTMHLRWGDVFRSKVMEELRTNQGQWLFVKFQPSSIKFNISRHIECLFSFNITTSSVSASLTASLSSASSSSSFSTLTLVSLWSS